mgnify:CR=1 FL=1
MCCPVYLCHQKNFFNPKRVSVNHRLTDRTYRLITMAWNNRSMNDVIMKITNNMNWSKSIKKSWDFRLLESTFSWRDVPSSPSFGLFSKMYGKNGEVIVVAKYKCLIWTIHTQILLYRPISCLNLRKKIWNVLFHDPSAAPIVLLPPFLRQILAPNNSFFALLVKTEIKYIEVTKHL